MPENLPIVQSIKNYPS